MRRYLGMKAVFYPLMLLLVLVVQACGKADVPAPEESCHFQQNGYLQRVSWRSVPVKMYADLSLNEEQVVALQEAIEIWNEALSAQRNGQTTFVFSGVLKSQIGLKNDYMNVVSISNDWDDAAAEQAETLLLWEGTSILEADIRLNGKKRDAFSVSDEAQIGKIDLVALYVHELGHVLGLLHIDETEGYTTMAVYLPRGTVDRRQVGQVELDALKCEY